MKDKIKRPITKDDIDVLKSRRKVINKAILERFGIKGDSKFANYIFEDSEFDANEPLTQDSEFDDDDDDIEDDGVEDVDADDFDDDIEDEDDDNYWKSL